MRLTATLMPLVWLLYLYHMATEVSGLWWTVGSRMITDPNWVCRKAKRLRSPTQNRMCKEDFELVRYIIAGTRRGIEQCQHELRFHRWNCTEQKKSIGNMLLRETRETAFVNAITAGAVAHAIAEGCAKNHLVSCACDHNLKTYDVKDRKWKWGGCGDNYEFGYKKSRDFMDADNKAVSDIRRKISHHNNEVGRMVIGSSMRVHCKCHGLSGGCDLKTCYKKLPKLVEVGEILYKKFEQAKEVQRRNDGYDFEWVKQMDDYSETEAESDYTRRRSTAIPEDLVYVEKSANLCQRNPKLGVLGTKGRQCNNTAGSEGNCDYLCCGRGVRTRTQPRETNCNCKFHWCCEVICDVCVFNETVHRCM